MRCEDAAEWFGVYRDLPEHSDEKLAVDLHVQGCRECAEEFRIWEESAMLIQELPLNEETVDAPVSPARVNEAVMSRIYAEQSWFMPATRRTYAFSLAFRKRVASVLAALLALFITGFLYAALGGGDAGSNGKRETANALAASHQYGDSIRLDVPVASLSDPLMLNVSPAVPEYWIAFSIVGLIMTLLIMNWFSRVRA
ncbi:anti-sigma factor family protein [Paenibacillaceae bacterium WGS1546]|uniref:anti-sigma factor family protein n=1 Tax=Cohnella sp. WGS1546 TaxID=3366810 RepID=UPI00372D4516